VLLTYVPSDTFPTLMDAEASLMAAHAAEPATSEECA